MLELSKSNTIHAAPTLLDVFRNSAHVQNAVNMPTLFTVNHCPQFVLDDEYPKTKQAKDQFAKRP